LRTINRLSARRVATISTPGLHADGGGLYLRVAKDGNGRSWVLLFRKGAKRTELGLGSSSTMSLADARREAAACRRLLLAGEDPRNRRGNRTPTFGQVADDYVAAHEKSWSNPKHVAQWKMTLRRYAGPLRQIPINRIGVEDVVRVLRPIWQRVPETAARVRGRIEAVLDAAKAQGLRGGENPAVWKGNLKHLLPARAKLTRGHHAALPYNDLPGFMARLRKQLGVAARALEFAILTAARSNEARGAMWDEVDVQGKVWIVPASRMKAHREHRVPLSDRAIATLGEMGKAGRTGLIFPGLREGPLSDASLGAVLKRMEVDVTVHGFRSTFKDWARECTSFQNELSEAALAHVIGDKVEAAYARGDVLERRRELMDAWAVHCGATHSRSRKSARAGERA
jgi:integrase